MTLLYFYLSLYLAIRSAFIAGSCGILARASNPWATSFDMAFLNAPLLWILFGGRFLGPHYLILSYVGAVGALFSSLVDDGTDVVCQEDALLRIFVLILTMVCG